MRTPVTLSLQLVDEFTDKVRLVLAEHDAQMAETLRLVDDNDEVREALQARINRE